MAYTFIGKSDFDDLAILDQPGKIVVNPFDLQVAFPYGGDFLGHALGGIDLRPDAPIRALSTSDESTTPYSYVWSGFSEIKLYAAVQEMNSVTAQMAFPGLVQVSLGDPDFRLQFPGGLPHGLLDAQAVRLLFVPDNPDHTYALLLQDAVPFLEESARLSLGYEDPTEFMLVWRCRKKEGYNPPEEAIGVWDRLENLTL